MPTTYTDIEMEIMVLLDNPGLTDPQVKRAIWYSIWNRLFTPAEPTDWNFESETETLQAVLDELGSRVAAVDAQVPQDAGTVTYTPAQTADWPGADPTEVGDALDLLAARLNVLEP